MTLVVVLSAPCPRCRTLLVLPFGSSRLERPGQWDVRVLPTKVRRSILAPCPACSTRLVARLQRGTLEVQGVRT